MRVLVTGAGGFVAGHLARDLHAHGHKVFGLRRSNASAAPDFGHDLHSADLVVPGAARQVIEQVVPDAIVHLAAQSNPARSWLAPQETFETNVQGTIELVRACTSIVPAPRILCVSSSDVYGIPDESEIPLTERASLRPSNPYAVSKVAAEQCARLYAEREGLSLVIARPFSHTGQGQSPDFVVPAFGQQIAQIESGRRLVLEHGDLHAWRDFSDVRDIVAAYRLLIETDGTSGIYNICSGISVSIAEILDRLIALSSSPHIETQRVRKRTRGDHWVPFRGDATRLREATDWIPRHTLDQTLQWVLDEQRALASVESERAG